MSFKPFLLAFLGVLALVAIIGVLLHFSGFTSPSGPTVTNFWYEQTTPGPSSGQDRTN